jgi:hypothetical protein
MDNDGKITINGKEVDKILVNGKPFFDKDGKIASKPIYNLGEPEFIEAMTKETGVAAPAAPQAELNMDPSILAPEMAAPQPAK